MLVGHGPTWTHIYIYIVMLRFLSPDAWSLTSANHRFLQQRKISGLRARFCFLQLSKDKNEEPVALGLRVNHTLTASHGDRLGVQSRPGIEFLGIYPVGFQG